MFAPKQAVTFAVAALASLLVLTGQSVRPGEAFAPPTELIGYRACTHLMLRLVDCLIDACELQLDSMNAANGQPKLQPLPDETQTQLVDFDTGKIGPILEEFDSQQDEDDSWMEDDDFKQETNEMRSTKPMNWLDASILFGTDKENKTDDTVEEHTKEETTMQTSGCWQQAIEWLKSQLLAVRMRLLLSNPPAAGLADALEEFAKLQVHLEDVCTSENPIGLSEAGEKGADDVYQARASLMEFILESVGVLAELEAEARQRQEAGEHDSKRRGRARDRQLIRPRKAIKLSEQVATESIKRQYSYLTQLITTYNLIFNQI